MPLSRRLMALWPALLAVIGTACGEAPVPAPDAGGGASVELSLAFRSRTSRRITSLPLQVTGAAFQLQESYPDGPWAALPLVTSSTDVAALDGDLLVAVGSVPPGRYARIRVDAFATNAVLEGGGSLPVASHVEPIAAVASAETGSTLRGTVELVLLDDASGHEQAWLFVMDARVGLARP